MSLGTSTTRRQFLRLITISTVGGALLAACAPAQEASPTQTTESTKVTEPTKAAQEEKPTVAPTPEPKGAIEPVRLSLYSPYGGYVGEELKLVVAKYHEVNPNVVFDEPIMGGAGSTSYIETLLARIAAGDPPSATILWDSPAALGVRGALTELDEMMANSEYSALENWPEGAMASCEFKGKHFGFPSFNAVYSLWYNSDVIKEAGYSGKREDFPKTWDEWRELAGKVTIWEGDNLKQLGYLPNWQYFTKLYSAINGGTLFDPDSQQYRIDSKENIEMAEYAVAWVDEQLKGDWAKVHGIGWDFGEFTGGELAFNDGRMIMKLGGNFHFGIYKTQVVPQFRPDFAPYPLGPSATKPATAFWGNWTAIPKGSKNVKEAFAFIDWFNGVGVEYWAATQPDLPGCRKFRSDFYPKLVEEIWGKDEALKFQQFYREQFELAAPMWTSPVESFSDDQVMRAMERILTKTARAADALGEAQKASQNELEKVIKSS